MKGIDLGEVHPNSVKMFLTGESGKELEIVAASIGGGRIQICEIDGLTANFSGDYPTLIVHNVDQPGHVTEVTSMLAHKSVNIATMQLYRKSRGGDAVMVIECDQEVPAEAIFRLMRCLMQCTTSASIWMRRFAKQQRVVWQQRPQECGSVKKL